MTMRCSTFGAVQRPHGRSERLLGQLQAIAFTRSTICSQILSSTSIVSKTRGTRRPSHCSRHCWPMATSNRSAVPFKDALSAHGCNCTLRPDNLLRSAAGFPKAERLPRRAFKGFVHRFNRRSGFGPALHLLSQELADAWLAWGRISFPSWIRMLPRTWVRALNALVHEWRKWALDNRPPCGTWLVRVPADGA